MSGYGNLRNLQQPTAHYNAAIAPLKFLSLLLTLLLAACGSPPEPQAASVPSSSTPTTVAAPRPSATAAVSAASSTAAPIDAPTLVPVPAAAATPIAASVPLLAQDAVPAGPQYKGILVSRTPDGFYALGAPEAPVTLTDYSDFL